MSDKFIQTGPELNNQFQSDLILKDFLESNIPSHILGKFLPHLNQVGGDASGKLNSWAFEARSQPPVHVPFSPWGERIDEIKTSQGWKNLEAYAAENGIVAAAYEKSFGEYSRIYQAALLYLFHPSSAIFSCPLAMTDGAARAIELYGDQTLKSRAYKFLTSRDPKVFWTSGQWMTEQTGGSDVSGTATTARHVGGTNYELTGTKWFTSATTSQMAMTLARIEGDDEGSRGLSLFYLELRDSNGKLNQIEIHRLKDKLGTCALPTAELSLNGTRATLVGGKGDGVKKISSLFNITRVYNSICALGQMRRGLALLEDFSEKRIVFGKKLSQQPLHQKTMFDLQTEFAGNFVLIFELAKLLGLDECNKSTNDEKLLLRLLTPLAKSYSAKAAINVSSEVVEGFGGAGYCEDVGIAWLLRDSQVLSIWEGTTNVLSLDALRAIEKDDALKAYLSTVQKKIKGLGISSKPLESQWQMLKEYLDTFKKLSPENVQANARELAFKLTEFFVALLLLEQSQKIPAFAAYYEGWLKLKKMDQ